MTTYAQTLQIESQRALATVIGSLRQVPDRSLAHTDADELRRQLREIDAEISRINSGLPAEASEPRS